MIATKNMMKETVIIVITVIKYIYFSEIFEKLKMETNESLLERKITPETSIEKLIRTKIRSNHTSPHSSSLVSPVFSPLEHERCSPMVGLSRNVSKSSDLRSPSIDSSISTKSEDRIPKSPHIIPDKENMFRYYESRTREPNTNERIEKLEKIVENLTKQITIKDEKIKALEKKNEERDDRSEISEITQESNYSRKSRHSRTSRSSPVKKKIDKKLTEKYKSDREYFHEEDNKRQETQDEENPEEEEQDEIIFPDFQNMSPEEIRYYRETYYRKFQLIREIYPALGFKAPDVQNENLELIHQIYCEMIIDIEQLQVAEKLKTVLIMVFAGVELLARYLGFTQFKGFLSLQIKTIGKYYPFIAECAKYLCSKKFKKIPTWIQFGIKMASSFTSFTMLKAVTKGKDNDTMFLELDKFVCPEGSKIKYKEDFIPDVPDRIGELFRVADMDKWVPPVIDSFLGDVEQPVQAKPQAKPKEEEEYEDVEF